MGLLNDLLVRIRGDNKGLDKSLDDSKKGIQGFKGSLMAAAAAGAAAFKVLIDWAKDTTVGIEAINVATRASKQLLTDLITGQRSHIKEAIENAKKQSKINDDNILEGYELKTMQSELAQLITASADQTKSHAEKLDLLTQAMEKERQIKAFLLADAREELKVAYDNWEINKQSISAKKAYYEIAGRIREIEGMDSRRLQSQYSGELKAQADRADDLVDAFTDESDAITEVNKALTEQLSIFTRLGTSVFSPKTKGLAPAIPKTLAGGPQSMYGTNLVAEAMAEAWQEQIDEGALMEQIEAYSDRLKESLIDMRAMAIDYGTRVIEDLGAALAGGDVKGLGERLLMGLADLLSQFGRMLITLALGESAFVKSLKNPLLWPIALAAGAAMLVTAGVIRGVLSSAGESMGSGGGGGYSGGGASRANASFQTNKVELVGVLKGSDIYLSGKRYAKELSSGT
jgi:hypothetical protein